MYPLSDVEPLPVPHSEAVQINFLSSLSFFLSALLHTVRVNPALSVADIVAKLWLSRSVPTNQSIRMDDLDSTSLFVYPHMVSRGQ